MLRSFGLEDAFVKTMPSILFVCTANICRSPMAAVLFQRLAQEKLADQPWCIESAGTWTRGGQPASAGAQAAMRSRGLDLSRHRSREVTREMLASFDLVLTMERAHQEAIRAEFPQLAGRVFMLSEAAGSRGDIEDPYGGAQADYDETADLLERLLRSGFERIIQLAQNAATG